MNDNSELQPILEAAEGEPARIKRNNHAQNAEDDPHKIQTANLKYSKPTTLYEQMPVSKDPKSFIQNLFDTFAMSKVQVARVSLWESDEDRDPCQERKSTESSSDIAPTAVAISSKSNSGQQSAIEGQEVCTNKKKSSNGKTSSPGGESRGGLQENLQYCDGLSNNQLPEGKGHMLKAEFPRSFRAQALSHFTSVNVAMMVSLIKNMGSSTHEEYQILRSLGRTEQPINPLAFETGNATQQDMAVVFGLQSITNVLGSTTALLESFRHVTTPESSSAAGPSASFREITIALRALIQVDYHPSNIFSSLWESVGKLYLQGPVRSKNPRAKIRAQSKTGDEDPESPLRQQRSNPTSSEANVLDDAEAAHVAKIAFAALVASIPICGPAAWFWIRNFRASGYSSPIPEARGMSSGTIDHLLTLLDALNNEISINLMTRLVKAIAARLCTSEISRNQRLTSKNDTSSLSCEKNVLEMVVDHLSDSEGTNYWAEFPDDILSPDNVLNMTPDLLQNSPDTPSAGQASKISPLNIIVEWLRSVVLREWDGKAEIPRWGAVGGALEFLSHLCRRIIFYSPYCLGIG